MSAPVLTRLRAALDAAGIDYTLTHHAPVRTSAEAAAVRGTPIESGAKALVVKGAGDDFVMAVMPADRALDGVALRKLIGASRLRFATEDELLGLTGLAPGAIPPFGSLFGLETICDERLALSERINFTAGGHCDSMQMGYADYVAFESPRLARIAKRRGDAGAKASRTGAT